MTRPLTYFATAGLPKRRTRVAKTRTPLDELSMAVLSAPITLDDGRTLPIGSRGAIVFVYENGAAYEFEFSEPFSTVVTIEAQHLKEAMLA
ncbi:DUF4926 domain-containing protein [Methylobacterium sp. J-090]|uniref:DUF4926 domain-containing protein n=1 Tax=Methylobacterium sp. J-090 TaxID=2836666 RepID=UPI001FB97C26|nr:DUF4926 domain-containing protein [Methylobacterium sp. J-090]MCJ2083305.1 DUF4926 domain-containing protein [Methylobacterium sp. J-090]